MYDKKNIFAKMLKKEIDADIIFENDLFIVIKDIRPIANVHLLFIPKVECISFDDFIMKVDKDFAFEFFYEIRRFAHSNGLSDFGYKLIMNHGKNAGQEIYHFHVHLISDFKNFEL